MIAVVLCGGASSRMGRPKAWLPVDGETLLGRTLRIAGDVCDRAIVVAAPGQELPALSASVAIVRDAETFRGPLAGFATGLAAIADDFANVALLSCDMPFVSGPFLQFLESQLTEPFDAVVPEIDGRRQPLCAVYRASVKSVVAVRSMQNRRFLDFVDAISVKPVTLADIPLSLREPPPWASANTPAQWAALGLS
jgi:molybdopterin-guanine dinucleotide biosynthesis protein A